MGSLCFAVVGDLHVGAVAEEVQTTIRLVNGMDLDFALFLGDLVNEPTDENVDEFVRQVRRIVKPVYLVIGNHDAARQPEGYDIEARIAAAMPGPWSDSFTYAFRCKGWDFIVASIGTMLIGNAYTGPQINRMKGHVSENGGMIYMPRGHLERFGRLLEESGDEPTCVVMHTPLLQMSHRIRRRGCFSQVRLLEQMGVLSMIEDRPNVKVLLYGHDHFNQVEVVNGRLHVITQGVRGYGPYKDTHAIRIVEIEGGTVRSRLVWDGLDGQPPGVIGTLEGDKAFQWSF